MNRIKSEILAGREYLVILPKDYEESKVRYPVVYLNGDIMVKEFLESCMEHNEAIAGLNYIIVCTVSGDRLMDFTPWAAPNINILYKSFGGGGKEYLQWMVQSLKPAIDRTYKTLTDAGHTAIMGQSLGGLIALFSLSTTDKFGYIASISASCWYPDFAEYMERADLQNSIRCIYMSSGKTEGAGHKDIKQNAVPLTKKVYGILSQRYTDQRVIMSWDDGGHHEHLEKRYTDAFAWLENKLVEE